MKPARKKPVRKAAQRNKRKPRDAAPQRINIFISYASEDVELVASIHRLLNDTFAFAPLFIYRDIEIKQGQNYATAIDEALDQADILLVIFTERMKMSHSYTGYEVGYFNRSKRQHPVGSTGLERIYIPFCIGADIPDSLHYIEGMSIGKDEIYKVLKTNIQGGTNVDADHPVSKFLTRISDFVMQIVKFDDANFGASKRIVNLESPASQLYRILHEYLQSRIWSETYPERKLIIRTAKRPSISKDGVDLSTANVELVGDFSDIFQVSSTASTGREYSWPAFRDMVPAELQTNCIAGIQHLTAEVLKGSGDNYHVVTTVDRDKSFRLFVSKVVTYVSQKTEIDIYVVQIRTKEYGDRLTTRLLKAISVGLRFRFLVLEEQSQFRPDMLGHPIVLEPELKVKITEMLAQMDLILREAAEADLQDPNLLILIWGKKQNDKIQKMMKVWEDSMTNLYAAAEVIFSPNPPDDFAKRKAAFIAVLTVFCTNIEQMNSEFTSRVLSLLASQVQTKLTPPAPEVEIGTV